MAPDPQVNQSPRELVEECDLLLPPAVVTRDVTGGYDSYSSVDSTLIGLPASLKVYKRRWWIVAVFAYLSFCQSLIWITWNSIAASAKLVYTWSDGVIALMADWGNIPFVFCLYPACWLLEVKGLRVSTVLTAVFLLAGAALRCIPVEPSIATILIHIAQIANGIAGVITLGAASMVSASWFPMSQRTKATSIVLVLNSLGVALGFFLGPFIVHSETNRPPANTSIPNSSFTQLSLQDDIAIQKNEIMHLLNIELVLAMVGFACSVIYFPKQPPLPPTATAAVEKLHFKAMMGNIFRSRQFWIIGLGYSIGNSVASNWLGVIETVLAPMGILQQEAGNLGAYSIIAGCIASIIMASLVDAWGGRIKLCLIVLWTVGTATYIWYMLMYIGVLPAHKGFLYTCTIVTGILGYSNGPLYMELLSEVTYPIPEGIVGVCLMAVVNVFGTIFLLLFLIPGIGLQWVNWCLIGSGVHCIILACMTDETYKRSSIDRSLVSYDSNLEEES